MRFRAIEDGGRVGTAASSDGRTWHVLFQGEPGFPGLPDDIVRSSNGSFDAAAKAIAKGKSVGIDSLSALPPFRRPSKILCVGLNYVDHATESGTKVPDYPTVFARFASSLIGHGEPLIAPKVSESFDYEAELVAVVGKRGRNIAEADALKYIAGYSLFNDGSIRDYQLRTPQWTIGKNFDGTGAFGPDFVTADELPPGAAGLRIQGRLNGQVMQDASTSDMVFGVARLVSLISVAMTLEAGDVIVTGTPSGVGLGRKPPLMMKEGDRFEVEIEKIGVLSNPVKKER